MNLFKLIKTQDKNTVRSIELRDSVVKSIVDNIDSAQAISRVVHNNSYNRWNPALDASLAKAFKKALDSRQFYNLTRDEQNLVLLEVSNKTGRSPCSVKIRLKQTGVVTSFRAVKQKKLAALVTAVK